MKRGFWLLLMVALNASAWCEPAEGAANDYGRWRSANGEFVPINEPAFVTADEASIAQDAEVIGVELNGEARAYPLRLITYHHVVNDKVGGKEVAVTYCGMANSAVVYERGNGVGTLEAGALYGGTLALKDQRTAECWPQIATVAVPDDAPTTSSLRIAVPCVITTWESWRTAHPRSMVLTPVEKFAIRYEAYDRRHKGFTPNPKMNSSITRVDERLEPGVEFFGVARGNESQAMTLETLKSRGKWEPVVDGAKVTVVWDKTLDAPRVEKWNGGFALRAYWYAWSQFHPETTVEK